MSKNNQKKKENNFAKVMALILAGLMVFSVIAAAVALFV